ncbi:hypothetical protein PG999_013337 [Apiospora kogelbergensis]|uniref:CoA-binding domain-containing protein n=1 Tax=Apiospora kogelbergensis TaxID=1337665 RepID=A0AAW0QE43_9PEZI
MLSHHVLHKTRPHIRLPRWTEAVVACRSSFGTTPVNRIDSSKYNATLKNLHVGRHTRVIFQGFTGRQATANAKESIAWGTNIVGGVTPGREGQHLELPAVEALKPDATGIYVAAHHAKAAIEEAIEAEVPLIVAVAEHVPLHDILRVSSMTRPTSNGRHVPERHTQCRRSASRLLGANSPGIISAVGKCRIGFQPLPCFEPGKVGIVAKSGTLSYETAASTLRAGLGQSLCIGVGGDVLSGTSLVDGLKILAEDESTEAIAICGEIGGYAEIQAAEWIKDYRARTRHPKPIAAIIAGINAAPGRVMGHAGAVALPGEPDTWDKIEALLDAGVEVVNHPSRFGPVLKSSLSRQPQRKGPESGITATVSPTSEVAAPLHQQRRTLHSFANTHQPLPTYKRSSPRVAAGSSRRTLHLAHGPALEVLRQCGINTHETPQGTQRMLAVSINRTTSLPCIIAHYPGRTNNVAPPGYLILSFLDSPDQLRTLVRQLVDLFIAKEAFLVQTYVTMAPAPTPGSSPERRTAVQVTDAYLCFDDAALRSGNRQADVHSLRDLDCFRDPAEASAESHGIVYIKLGRSDSSDYARRNIGTLVNGAGLAMNTVDALADAGGKAANFLDTGGKATSETVKRSFEAILQDQRVKCIFVNIFGGLTLGDMIARGIVLAFQDLEEQLATIPVVVRIRGTNEAEGQKIIADSGLPGLYAFDDFDEAAAKAVELATAAAGREGGKS